MLMHFHISSFFYLHTTELNDFVIELDEEVVGMQSTICALQQQLKEAKQELSNIKNQKPTDSTPIVEPMAVEPMLSSPTIKEEPKPVVVKEERTSDPPDAQHDESRTDLPRTNPDETAQAFTEPTTRQSPSETLQSTSSSWAPYAESEAAAEKSPSTPTEEEAFRIPEAPRTMKMEPTSPAIPDEASSGPGPDEEARTSISVKEEPMEVDTVAIKVEKSEEERTFQVSPQEPEEQVTNRTTDGEAVPPLPPSVDATSNSSEERSSQRTEGTEEVPPVESSQVVATEERTPENQIMTEAVPEPTKAAQETDTQVKVDIDKEQKVEVKERQEQENSQEAHVDTNQVSNSSTSVPSQGIEEDSNKADIAPSETTSNGNVRTEPDQVSSSSETVSSANRNENTKNGEFSPTHSPSPHPPSSERNNAAESNCKSSNSPSSNNIEEGHSPQTSLEERTDSSHLETVPSNESPATAVVASDAAPADDGATDRTISPVKQVVVKSSDGDVAAGEGDVGIEKQQNVDDVPPLKENGPEMVSN